jgi:2-polyprenyl-6-methoxyphenol hydroxylase-like FAD-dependent oxidoreductase
MDDIVQQIRLESIMDRLEVVIIGAGVGGLCLAQGLKLSGMPVKVFERDASRTSPVEGYRLSISATGSGALKSCLPEKVFEKLTMETAKPSRGVTFLDHKLKRLLAIDFPHSDRRSVESERPVSRTALRRVLLDGLDDVVHFGKKFVAFENEPDGRVAALFADGSRTTADLLVGADGANSAVRTQLLPEAKRLETGIVAVGGRLPLGRRSRPLIPEALMQGPTPILGPLGCFMFVSAVQYSDVGDDPEGGLLGSFADDREDYLMWGFTARRRRFAASSPLDQLDGCALKQLVGQLMTDWHPDLRRLVQMTDPAAISSFSVKTSTPVPPWTTRNVTLLGDALHNMPPFRGVGANTALWDAALLRETIAADRDKRPLLERLAAYERQMIDHGFRAVRTSLADMKRFHSENALSRTLTKAFLRTIDRAPALRAMLMEGR